MKQGKVYLIGAGPGDPGLLTLKGRDCLAAADCVVYDHLLAPEILGHARADAERVFVGKEASHHTMKQEEINALLASKARAGCLVARLKGGDPFLFGRGGEEAAHLKQAGIPFEVVPGVTSAVAVPAYAGIPVTHRGYVSSFMVITGHRATEERIVPTEWENIAGNAGTLIFLMGVHNLENIAKNLIKFGRPPETPVAVVEWGTYPHQRTVEGTLETIVGRAEAAEVKPPAVIVVGEVVKLRPQLRWFDLAED
jgi:uroporphyrinogen III methyltransferase / synthase